MTVVTLVKTLPVSLAYTASGNISPCTINLIGCQQFSFDSKNTRVTTPVFKVNYLTNPIDSPVNMVVADMQDCVEQIKLTGWIEDDATETAWNKLWKLRAMVTMGGPLYTLTIGTAVPMVFPSPNPLIAENLNTFDDAQQKFIPYAFLDHVMAVIEPDDTGDITASFSGKPVRIKVDLDFSLGTLPIT